jgi:NaMN:DMB phosphoribosyltransferase
VAGFDLNQWLTDFGIPLADPYHGMLMRFSHEELEALVRAAQSAQRERDALLVEDSMTAVAKVGDRWLVEAAAAIRGQERT